MMNNTEIDAAARERLHQEILAELGTRGLDDIRLDLVLERARVPAADFAANYESVEACLFEAYASLTDRLDTIVRVACGQTGPNGSWETHVQAGLRALLTELSRDSLRSTVLVQAFPALGQRAQARFQAFAASFAPLLEGGREAADANAELPREVEALAVGAAEAIVFEEIVAGRAAGLIDLLPEIAFSVLVPFIGPARAGAEMQKLRG